jgi:hypothetical protein
MTVFHVSGDRSLCSVLFVGIWKVVLFFMLYNNVFPTARYCLHGRYYGETAVACVKDSASAFHII